MTTRNLSLKLRTIQPHLRPKIKVIILSGRGSPLNPEWHFGQNYSRNPHHLYVIPPVPPSPPHPSHLFP